MQCLDEVRAACSVLKLELQLSFSHIATQSKSNQFYELIQFISLWFWFVKVSRVKLFVS